MIWMVKILSNKFVDNCIIYLFKWLGKHSLIILCFHLIELNTIPWERILNIIGITRHLFIPTLVFKLGWSISWVLIVEKTKIRKIFYCV